MALDIKKSESFQESKMYHLMFSVLKTYGSGDTWSQPVCHEAMVISLIVISKVRFSIACYL